MTRKTHLQISNLAVDHLGTKLDKLNQKLSDLYILLNRPLDAQSQTRALTIAHESMSLLRTMQEDRQYMANSHRGIDSDLAEVSKLIDTLRGIRKTEFDSDVLETGRAYEVPPTESLEELAARINGGFDLLKRHG